MTIENVITDRLWFSNTKILLMKQYVEVCLLRCEYDEAFKCLKSLVAYCNEDGSGGGKRWHRYHKEIALLWGLLYQSVHMVKEAEEWLTIAATADSVNSSLSAFEQSVAQKEEDEIRFMANISLMLLTATNQPSPAAERGGGGGGDVASNGKVKYRGMV